MAEKKNNHSVLVVFLVLLFALVVEGFFFYEKLNDVQLACDAMTRKEQDTLKRLEEMERLEAYNRQYIDRMMKDPEFLQTEVRSRLGVTVPGEVVIREEGAERRAGK